MFILFAFFLLFFFFIVKKTVYKYLDEHMKKLIYRMYMIFLLVMAHLCLIGLLFYDQPILIFAHIIGFIYSVAVLIYQRKPNTGW